MHMIQKPRFLPLDPVDGYLPITDHGLIGDGTTAGLVGRDGALVWLCLPRFDAPPLFCRLLDARRGGAFTIAPEDIVTSRQFYEPSTGVLVTEMRSPSGLVQLTDALLLRAGIDLSEGIAAGRHQLLRAVRVLQGRPAWRRAGRTSWGRMAAALCDSSHARPPAFLDQTLGRAVEPARPDSR